MTYRPIEGSTCDHCRARPAEHGYWQRTSHGETRRYCWVCYQQITDLRRHDSD